MILMLDRSFFLSMVISSSPVDAPYGFPLWTVLVMLFGAKIEDHNSLKNIPSSDKAIAERCRKVAGFAPYYCIDVLHSNARSSFVWAFLLRLNEGSDEVPVCLKHVSMKSL